VYTGLWWENLWKRNHLGNLSIDGRILKCIFKTWYVAAWADLVPDRERWHILANAVMKLQVLQNVGYVSFSRRTLLHQVFE